MSLGIYIFIAILIPVGLYGVKTYLYKDINGTTICKIKWGPSLLFAFVATILLRGLAYDTGADWFAYFDYIEGLRHGYETPWGEHTEYLYRYLCMIIVKLGLPTVSFFIICMILNYTSILKVAKLFYWEKPAIFLFWTIFLFNQSCNIYRQYIAMAFVLFCVYYILVKNYRNAILSLLAAVGFHTSVLIIFPLLFGIYLINLKGLSLNKWYIIIAILIMHYMGYSALGFISSLNSSLSYLFAIGNGNIYEFSVQNLAENSYGATYLHLLIPTHLFWVYIGDKIKDEYPNFRFVYYTSCLYMIIYPVADGEFLMRMSLYFSLFMPYFLATMFGYFRNNGNKNLYFVLMVSLVPNIILFLYQILVARSSDTYTLVL